GKRAPHGTLAGQGFSAARAGGRLPPCIHRPPGRMLGGVATSKAERVSIEVAGREIAISNPSKVYFPEAGITKLEVVRYYLAVAEGALRGAGDRPNVLVRYADGIHSESFYQKRAPAS